MKITNHHKKDIRRKKGRMVRFQLILFSSLQNVFHLMTCYGQSIAKKCVNSLKFMRTFNSCFSCPLLTCFQVFTWTFYHVVDHSARMNSIELFSYTLTATNFQPLLLFQHGSPRRTVRDNHI